jgi:hypothetical protein
MHALCALTFVVCARYVRSNAKTNIEKRTIDLFPYSVRLRRPSCTTAAFKATISQWKGRYSETSKKQF